MSNPSKIEMISAESAALATKKSDSRLGASTSSPVQKQDILSSKSHFGSSTKTTTEKKKRKPMLTSSQLSDLFTRLDKNGDGELDLDEFTGIIKMLRIQVTPDYVARVFRSVDQTTGTSEVSGTLDMQEFIAAYQKIYCGANVDDVGAATKHNDNFIRATRYGCQADGQFIFECYTIPSRGATERFIIPNLPRDGSILGNSEVTKHDGEEHLHKLKTANKEMWTGTVDDIIIMIRDDSIKNKAHHASVFWWIDLAYSSVDRTIAEDIVTKFGLPNDSKFLSSFGNFGSGMPGDPKSRVFAGIGNHMSGNVYSLSYFIQSMWIKGVPVVHHLPPWLHSLQCFTCNTSKYLSNLSNAIMQYYTSRFAWMANFSWLNRSAKDEQMGAYERAEGLAMLLKKSDVYEDDDDDDELDMYDQQQEHHDAERSKDYDTIFSSRGGGVSLGRRQGYAFPPTWLQTSAHIRNHPPALQMDTLSMHILDQGYGANALLTVRQMDGEHQKRLTLEQQSRAGVLGRIISGVWAKVAEVTMRGRGTGVGGEITDSPASLVTFLAMLVHNFSMNSAAPVDYWLNVLEKEIKDIVVSKHVTHVAEVERILKDFNSYLDPIESILRSLSAEQEEFALHVSMEANSRDDFDTPREPLHSSPGVSPIQLAHKTASPLGHAPLIPSLSGLQKHRTRRKAATEAPYTEALPDNIEKVALNFAHIYTFFGDDPYREIRTNLDGYEQLEVKGLIYWKERLKRYSNKIDSLKELIAIQLDEKRNFMSFMLTIITTILAPLAILTGYFGMNFENMTELSETTYKTIPGVTLMWVLSGVIYSVLLLIAFHFRVLYSAT